MQIKGNNLQNIKIYPQHVTIKDLPIDSQLQNKQDNLKIAVNNSKYTRIIWKTHSSFHKHSFWEICLTLKGKGIHHFPDHTENMVPGSVWILRPDDVHYIEPLGHPTFDYTSSYAHRDIYIKPDKMKRILNAFDTSLYDDLINKPAPLSAIIPLNYVKQIESMINYFSMNNEDFEFMHSVIVSHILSCTIEQKNYTNNEFPNWLNTLISNLNQEEFMVQPMNKIIDSTGYSQSYVCRQFKKYMKITLVQYIRQIKCLYSLSLLADTNVMIIDIAYKLNFSDESSYINIFKNIYNITPGQWRKSLKSK